MKEQLIIEFTRPFYNDIDIEMEVSLLKGLKKFEKEHHINDCLCNNCKLNHANQQPSTPLIKCEGSETNS